MRKRGISWIITIAIFIIILTIIVKLNLLGPIKDWIMKEYIFPEQCVKLYPAQYKHIIYDYCNLQRYNLTKDDIIVKTYYQEPDTCHFMVYIKDRKVYEYSLRYGEAKVINCEDLIQRWLSE
ncbi:MAG TPA: hypothetical protein EYP32_07610 [Aquificaceae bacterium]|nr:hypothetical protein [Aquificaceae bacterium]